MNGEIDSSRFTSENYSFFSPKRTHYSFDWYNWEDDSDYCGYTDEEELLLDMCNCYGIDEDDVILLLDYGYTAMEDYVNIFYKYYWQKTAQSFCFDFVQFYQ